MVLPVYIVWMRQVEPTGAKKFARDHRSTKDCQSAKLPNPSTSEYHCVWGHGLYRTYEVPMRSGGLVLIQSDWCPHKKDLDIKETPETLRDMEKDHVKTH